jgi:hypothetical protein
LDRSPEKERGDGIQPNHSFDPHDDVQIAYPADWRTIPPEKWAGMMMTPEEYTAMRDARVARERKAPRVGDAAPDFTLERLAADGSRTGEAFTLSSVKGRPVGLIFGSYT